MVWLLLLIGLKHVLMVCNHVKATTDDSNICKMLMNNMSTIDKLQLQLLIKANAYDFTTAKEVMFSPAFVCLSVCLSLRRQKIPQKYCVDLDDTRVLGQGADD